MAAAGWRYVGEDLAAAAGHEPGEGLGLSTDSVREVRVKLMVVLDGSTVNVTASAGRVQVKRQHPAGTGAWVEYRHRARLPRSSAGSGRACRAG